MVGQLVLVTGGTGFLGSHVVKAAIDAGYRVRTTVRHPDDRKKCSYLYELKEAGKPVEIVKADLLDEVSAWTNVVKGCSYVLHVASPFYTGNKTEEELIEPAVEGTTVVLKAALAEKVKHIVLTSSVVAIYSGDYSRRAETKNRPYTEEDWTNVDGLIPIAQSYDKSKTLAEKAAWKLWEESGHASKLSTINPSLVIGPPLHGNDGTSMQIMSMLLKGSLPVIVRMPLGVVDVRDVAKAHVLAMENSAADGKRFILSKEVLTCNQLTEKIYTLMGKYGYKPPRTVLPNFVLKFFGIFAAPVRVMARDSENPLVLDNSRSQNILGLQYGDLDKSIKDTCEGLVKHGFVDATEKYRLYK
eukprot:Plantae.Rhodophyta-Purpureofilum_apyrenoidigerum.ctg16147.p1 GENE.Plantae.Rhodophyta-Purpureofilum_apyrenoidigerum.ctg16147~~Plantae.Rhodophyta-Purpureofilum_apyrenoidigerum.ctg16147.p1  ORF type:complete len:357 (+),score=61.40 Plantae.Rhodophyta-Purpureofilum_apyrenoidigerum.ctg16147:188-1258(+)